MLSCAKVVLLQMVLDRLHKTITPQIKFYPIGGQDVFNTLCDRLVVMALTFPLFPSTIIDSEINLPSRIRRCNPLRSGSNYQEWMIIPVKIRVVM
jgi:hypothetical protein